MDSSHTVKVLEQCKMSPPLESVPSTNLPLTFLDIPWLFFSPNQPLFFYDFPHSTAYFTQTIIPNLKHSLSLTLIHFFPLAGSLITPPEPSKPHLIFSSGGSVSLTIAESNGDFDFLSGHHSRNVLDFHQLVPHLTPSNPSATYAKCPLLSVQITIFPQYGVCFGFAVRQVAADGRTFDNFLKTWAAICRTGQHRCANLQMVNNFSQCHDRAMIHDPCELEQTFLKQWWNFRSLHEEVINSNDSLCNGMVRATFVVGRPEMEKIKGRIMTRSKKIFGSMQFLLSPYVVTCSYVWACWTKTHLTTFEDFLEEPLYFGFIAGGINRLGYSVPTSYIGNCIAFGRSMARSDQLMGEDGMVYAAKAIGDTIKELDREVLAKAENWILDWNELIGSELHVTITGSPKLGFYGLDFGWGIPRKIEEISIDKTHAISLCESRDFVGGIEVGLALPKAKMDAFGSLFHKGLTTL